MVERLHVCYVGIVKAACSKRLGRQCRTRTTRAHKSFMRLRLGVYATSSARLVRLDRSVATVTQLSVHRHRHDTARRRRSIPAAFTATDLCPRRTLHLPIGVPVIFPAITPVPAQPQHCTDATSAPPLLQSCSRARRTSRPSRPSVKARQVLAITSRPHHGMGAASNQAAASARSPSRLNHTTAWA